MAVVTVVVMRVVMIVIMAWGLVAIKTQNAKHQQNPCAVKHQETKLAVFVKQVDRHAKQKCGDQNADS